MRQDQEFFRDVVERTNYWHPSEDFPEREGFTSELMDFLDERLNRGSSLIGEEEDVSVKEHGGGITVDDRLFVLVTMDFSGTGKLSSRIESALEKFDFLIVVACGVEEAEEWRSLELRYQGTGFEEGEVEFIWKARQFYGEEFEGNRRGEEPLGGFL